MIHHFITAIALAGILATGSALAAEPPAAGSGSSEAPTVLRGSLPAPSAPGTQQAMPGCPPGYFFDDSRGLCIAYSWSGKQATWWWGQP